MRYLVIVFIVVALLITPAFAADESSEPEVGSNSQTVTVIEATDPVFVSDLEPTVGLRSSFLEALESIFGEYQPRTYSVTTYLPDGTAVTSTEIVPGLAGLDWVWIFGVGLFALFLFCLMRLLGGAVK